MKKPADLFDRDQEWADLAEFAVASAPGLRVGLVYGRRRQGKSYLLRRLAQSVNGFYHQALEIERLPALARFADDVAATLGLPPGQLSFSDWDAAFRTALGVAPRGSSGEIVRSNRPHELLIIDELPYLLAHSPEIPSVLQELWDEMRDAPASGVIVCGSALSVMTELLSGQRALRGRARLDLTLRPFDFRLAAEFWGISDPEVALRIGSIMGGTPGYKALIEQPPPRTKNQLPQWLGRNILNPAHALYNETGYLLREDPRIQDKALYNSILRAIASGASTPGKIGALLARNDRSLAHPLDVLVTGGFIQRDEDVLLQRRPTYRIADPIVRFSQLVLEPQRVLLEERLANQAWEAAAPSFSAGVLGPYFEQVAIQWTRRYAGDRWPLPVGEIGHTVINDTVGRSQHELDVVGLPVGVPRHAHNQRIAVLGEAKSADRPRTIDDLNRLDHIRGLLTSRGVDMTQAALVLFGRSGLDAKLRSQAAQRNDVHLVDLATIFAG